MDYYYALLDSYKLLKKRKLKLTIKEEMDDAGILNYLTTQGGGGTADTPNTVLGNIRLFAPKDEPGSITGGFRQGAARLVTSNQLEPYDSLNKTGKIIIDRIRNQQSEGEEGEGGEEAAEAPPPEDPVLRGALDTAAAAWETFKGEMGFQLSMFPGLKSSRGRIVKSVANILSKRMGKPKGFGGDKPEQVVDQMINTPCEGEPEEVAECNSNKIEGARALGELGTIFKSYKDKGGVMDEELAGKLRSLTPKLTITKSGIKFGEVFVFYKSKSSSKTDVLRNTVDQLNDAAEEYNKEWEDHPGGKIPLVTRESIGGVNRSMRGPAAEVIMGMSIALTNLRTGLENAKTPAERRSSVSRARKEVLEIFHTAKKDGTAEDLRDMFSVGSDVILGNILAMSDDQVADADQVEAVTNFLLKKGFSKEDVAELLEGAGDQVGKAIILLAYANRDFDFDLFGENPPTSVKHMGGTGSNNLGAKADIYANYEDTPCEEVSKYYDSLLSPEQKTHYDLGCGGDEGVGSESLVRPNEEGEGCQVSLEVKTLDRLRSNKGYGQSSNTRADTVLSCDSDSVNMKGENAASQEFLKLHDERMSNCGVSTKGACNFSKDLESKVGDIRAALDPTVMERSDGSPITLAQRGDTLQQWAMNKGGLSNLNDEDKNRYKAALRYVRGESGDLKGKDAAEAAAITDQLWQHSLAKSIEAEKPITGDAQDYLLSRLHLGAGSTEETGRVGRALEEGVQAFGLNNAEIMGCIGGVKSGEYNLMRTGNTYKIVDKDGTVRMDISAERGNFEIAGKKVTTNDIQKAAHQDEDATSSTDKMLLEFLRGQQKLLNELMKP